MTVLQVAVVMFLVGGIFVTAFNGSIRGNSKLWLVASVALVIVTAFTIAMFVS